MPRHSLNKKTLKIHKTWGSPNSPSTNLKKQRKQGGAVPNPGLLIVTPARGEHLPPQTGLTALQLATKKNTVGGDHAFSKKIQVTKQTFGRRKGGITAVRSFFYRVLFDVFCMLTDQKPRKQKTKKAKNTKNKKNKTKKKKKNKQNKKKKKNNKHTKKQTNTKKKHLKISFLSCVNKKARVGGQRGEIFLMVPFVGKSFAGGKKKFYCGGAKFFQKRPPPQHRA